MASEENLNKVVGTHHADRLSALPDDLLLRILGFLQLKGAVGTSALSRRWRYLWTRLTHLTLDSSSYEYSREEFGNLVQSVLRQCEDQRPFLKKFRLICYPPNDRSLVSSWMEAATGPEIETFEVDFREPYTYYHPSQRIFALEKLQVLKLRDWFVLAVPPSACFPRMLKELELWECIVLEGDSALFKAWLLAVVGPEIQKLCLNLERIRGIDLSEALGSAGKLRVLKLHNRIQLGADVPICLPCLEVLELYLISGFSTTLHSLISSSTALETLVLRSFQLLDNNATTLCIESSSLKNATVRRFRIKRDGNGASPRLVLKAPSLVHIDFFFFHDGVTEYDIHELHYLQSASIDYSTLCGMRRPRTLILLLNRISNATKLQLASSTFQAIILCGPRGLQLPLFHNLTHLAVVVSVIDRRTLRCLLDRAPNLVTLVLDKGEGYPFEGPWDPSEPDSECLHSRIEVIEIKGLRVTSIEKDLLIHWLDVALCLKRMILHCATDETTIARFLHSSNQSVPTREQHEMLANLEQLLASPRSSSNCEVEVLSYVDHNGAMKLFLARMGCHD